MNEQDLQSFRERLEKMRSDLVEDSEETVHEMREENNLYPDPSDRATSETEHINLLRIRDRERRGRSGRRKSHNQRPRSLGPASSLRAPSAFAAATSASIGIALRPRAHCASTAAARAARPSGARRRPLGRGSPPSTPPIVVSRQPSGLVFEPNLKARDHDRSKRPARVPHVRLRSGRGSPRARVSR